MPDRGHSAKGGFNPAGPDSPNLPKRPTPRRGSRSPPRSSSAQRALSLASLSLLRKHRRRLPPHPPPLRRPLLVPAAPLWTCGRATRSGMGRPRAMPTMPPRRRHSGLAGWPAPPPPGRMSWLSAAALVDRSNSSTPRSSRVGMGLDAGSIRVVSVRSAPSSSSSYSSILCGPQIRHARPW